MRISKIIGVLSGFGVGLGLGYLLFSKEDCNSKDCCCNCDDEDDYMFEEEFFDDDLDEDFDKDFDKEFDDGPSNQGDKYIKIN